MSVKTWIPTEIRRDLSDWGTDIVDEAREHRRRVTAGEQTFPGEVAAILHDLRELEILADRIARNTRD